MRVLTGTRAFPVALVTAVCALLLNSGAALAAAGSREGCKNQWLFNGVWRVKITDVQPWIHDGTQQGWQVTEVWRNGTSQELTPADSAFVGQVLDLQNGSINAQESTTGALSMSVSMNGFPPAGEYTYTQIFIPTKSKPDWSDTPKGLDITFNGSLLAQWKQPQFTTSQYNFHFNLGCVASGAVANAEGGSNQLAAKSGCVGEWMSNGIWKMRVDSLGTNPPTLTKPSDQFGWLVTQTWVNISGRGVLPGFLFDQGQKYVPTNVTDEFMATQGGKSASSANAVGGFKLGRKPGYDWKPGESWTFPQLFVWGNFDPTDKPIRLLVTFNDKQQNALPNVPHYHGTPNFRIDLTCTK